MTTNRKPATPLPWETTGVEEPGINGKLSVPPNWACWIIGQAYNLGGSKVAVTLRGTSHSYDDAAYIAHASNQYSPLIEALKEIRATTTDRACMPIIEEALRNAGEL